MTHWSFRTCAKVAGNTAPSAARIELPAVTLPLDLPDTVKTSVVTGEDGKSG